MKTMVRFVATLVLATGPALAAGEGDARQVLTLGEGQREMLKSEMRAMLEGTQQIVQGVADNNMKAVAKVARSVGAAMMNRIEDGHGHEFPPEFMQLGIATHADFDRIAVIAEKGGSAKQVAAQLGSTLNRCVACHATWRVHTLPATPDGEAAAHHESRH